MNDKLQGLLGKIEFEKQKEEKLRDSRLEGEQLLYKLCYDRPKTQAEWYDLHKRVMDFLRTDNPDSEKQKIMQYTEMLAMVISGFEYTDVKR